MSEPKSIKACYDRLAELGVKCKVTFTNLKAAQEAVAKAEARKAGKPAANKPSFPRNITPDNPANPTPFNPKTDGLGDAIAEAKSERDISRKIDMLQALSAKQFAAMQSESDAIRKTDLMRAWQSTEKSLAYAKLAERTTSPSAAKARRLLDMASE